MFFGVDILTSQFNRIVGTEKMNNQDFLTKMCCSDKGIICIGRIIETKDEEQEVISAIEKITQQKNGEFTFSKFSCGYYESDIVEKRNV